MDIIHVKVILTLVVFIGFPGLYFIGTGIFSVVRFVKTIKYNKFGFKYTLLPMIFWLCGSTILAFVCYFALLFSLWLIKNS